ncbi:MAG: Asp-tRNA(Asn)/Glu-tRNA(Gln) amidotransferase subunit GatC [Patescibacteria group bacterium]|nr:Asp-tRNA(Asn)/Glu-tRNA(Gln) amidotransferase subunit GatC [Patescibacteria group bacterium]MCL5224161.1 Asp-tRNA(Asn)/Glu-tRNA(Gln) amidotransferase subunit GatC [Patescibacteria group bacterium]
MEFDVEYFARLARIRLTDEEKTRLAKELSDVLAYVEELKRVDTKDVAPMTGGTDLRNIYREDESVRNVFDDCGKGPANFPDTKDGFLKVPKIFE